MAYYGYKYKRTKSQTTITGSQDVIHTMLDTYRDYLKTVTKTKHPINWTNRGIFPERTRKGYCIRITHPMQALATDYESNNFPHRKIAKQMTKLYRLKIRTEKAT